ncbi:hypothetical protein, partial [Bacillus mycoides]|uniref:hypothetical protein n=1 Tax=Bacillus mycoides TaxID=1405 RepID=UPI003A808BFF
QVGLRDDYVLQVFENVDEACQYILDLGYYKANIATARRYLRSGLRRRDGRYLDYRWVTEYDYVHGNYEKLIRNVFPKGDGIVQLFADSNEIFNVFATVEMAAYVTGLSGIRIRGGILNRNGFAGGYRWMIKSDYDAGRFPSPASLDTLRVQGVKEWHPIGGDSVMVLGTSGEVKGRLASFDEALDVYRIDGLSEITLKEMGRLPRNGDILEMESLFWVKQNRAEHRNPFNSRYIVEVTVGNKIVKEYRTVRSVAKELAMKPCEVEEILGGVYMGRKWLRKDEYYRTVLGL